MLIHGSWRRGTADYPDDHSSLLLTNSICACRSKTGTFRQQHVLLMLDDVERMSGRHYRLRTDYDQLIANHNTATPDKKNEHRITIVRAWYFLQLLHCCTFCFMSTGTRYCRRCCCCHRFLSIGSDIVLYLF